MKTIDFTVSEHNSEAIVFVLLLDYKCKNCRYKGGKGCSNEQIRMDKENNYNSYRFNRGSIWYHTCFICRIWRATLAVLWQGISKTFHVSIGMASMIVAVIMIVFAFFYDRSQIHIGTIIYQLVYSLVLICLQMHMCTVRIC